MFQIKTHTSFTFINSLTKQTLSILKINEKGTIISSWHSTNGKISYKSDIEVADDKLFFGSPYNNYFGVCKVPNGFL